MKKFTVIILAICMLLTSCAPAADTVSSAFGPNEQAVAAAIQGAALSAATQNTGEPPAFSTLEYTYDEMEKLPSAPSFDYAFSAPSSQWQNLAANETPAAFSQVSYEFVDDVLEVGQNVTNSIASAGQLMSGSTVQRMLPSQIVAEGGYVSRDILDAAAAQKGRAIENGTVVVDKASGTAFKVVSPTTFYDGSDQSEYLQRLEGSYAVAAPQLHEILKDFSLGGNDGETEEMVTVNRGNITGFAPNMEANLADDNGVKLMSFGDSYKGYEHILANYLVNLQFENASLDALLGDGSPIKVTVSGGIAIENIEVYARYTFRKGYALAATLRQESYLIVEMQAELAEEITIPVFEIGVGIGDVGRISGGVYVIVGLDGTLRVEVYAREYTSTLIGVRGKTAAYIPISVRPIFDQTIKGDGDVNLTGKINGSLKFGPMLSMKIFSFDLIGAGAFLGTGVSVVKDDTLLDVELYGILQVYVKFLGKHFDLANYKPTIFRKKQQDTAGHVVDIFEAYVYPGRVSGTIKKEPSKFGGAFVPVENMPYRIWVVPAGVSFDTNNANDLNNPNIRKYPANGYASTLEGGIFFQADENMLIGSDQVYLEFKVDGEPKPLFSNPASPVLPFTDYTITRADHFNHYVMGQVQPLPLINWDTGENEPVYYANKPVQVRMFLYADNFGSPIDTGGVAYARTDEYGNFDTRDDLIDDKGEIIPNWKFDFYWIPADKNYHYTAQLTVDDRGATSSGEVPVTTTMSLNFSRLLTEVPGSYERIEEGDKLIDRMSYNEYIWIVNPYGTRTVTDKEFRYYMEEFSTQDLRGLTDYTTVPESERDNLWLLGEGDKTLTPVLDANGDPTGAALFSQVVTVEWVWQEHKNPVKITSAHHTAKTAAGGTFQVTADGYAPFAFSLTGAPSGVVINKDTGLITIPAGLPKNEYTFTIRAEENRPYMSRLDTYLKYEGNDPSPPDEQVFTLKITELAVMPEPSPAPTPPLPTPTPPPSPTPTPPTPTPRTAPVIATEQHGYNFEMTAGGRKLTVPVTATGSTPITWSLVRTGQNRIPAAASIDPKTGVLTVGVDISAGTYYFTIRAENDAGSDIQECRLTVTEPRTAPVIAGEEHQYEFSRFTNWDAETVQINATGSTPITWSLMPTGRYPLPDAVSINSKTGVLTLGVDIATGMHRFTIKAENDVGYDTRDCTLEVKAPFIPIKPFGMQPSGVSSPSEGIGGVTLVSVPSGITGNPPVTQDWRSQYDSFFQEDRLDIDPSLFETVTPLNAVTIRYDDPRDVYTNDRWTVNGAAYVRWQPCPGVFMRWMDYELHPNTALNYFTTGTGTMLLDTSPRCDNYHFRVPSELEAFIERRMENYLNPMLDLDAVLGRRDKTITIPSRTQNATYLEYGTLLNQMKSQKGGSFLVELNQTTGAMITGKYFAGLLGNKGADLSFIQDGAAITFAGKDIKGAKEYEFFDFTYYPTSFYESDMLAGVGPDDKNFIFSFRHHGELPGMAAFAITTDLAEGTEVNVYDFDLEAGAFTLIAGNVTVGKAGVLTYKNNTMGQYLVTTKTLEGASISDVASQQGSAGGNIWPFIGIGLAVLLCGAAVFIVVRRRRQPGTPQ